MSNAMNGQLRVKCREAGRIVSKAVIIAVAVNTEGVREVLGMAIGPSEAEPFWTGFLRSLTRRGLRGVKLLLRVRRRVAYRGRWKMCRLPARYPRQRRRIFESRALGVC